MMEEGKDIAPVCLRLRPAGSSAGAFRIDFARRLRPVRRWAERRDWRPRSAVFASRFVFVFALPFALECFPVARASEFFAKPVPDLTIHYFVHWRFSPFLGGENPLNPIPPSLVR